LTVVLRPTAELRRRIACGIWRALLLMPSLAVWGGDCLGAQVATGPLPVAARHQDGGPFLPMHAVDVPLHPPPHHGPLAPLTMLGSSARRCIGDTWHYVHGEYLAGVFWHSSTHPRFLGLGEPLVSSSWRNRPFHVGWFVGPLFADNVTHDSTSEDASLFGGYRLGWDFDHYWGTEWRIGWTRPEIYFEQQPQTQEIARLTLTDVNLLYYPWGDSVIRPYGLLGVGITAINFDDAQDTYRDETLFSVPFGVGVKHHWCRWASWRLELLDNLAFGSGAASSMHNVSLTFGVEVHFGVRPRSYFPWNPSRHIW
jgi:hypothetical protein